MNSSAVHSMHHFVKRKWGRLPSQLAISHGKDIAEFSKKLNIRVLYEYAKEVSLICYHAS